MTSLSIQDEIQYAVDINPHKQGMFMAGTGQEIVAPDFLATYRPDLVVIMNPVYLEEILRDIEARPLHEGGSSLMDFRRLFAAVKRFWLVVLGILVLTVLAVALVPSNISPDFERREQH
ncbi:MAG: hypothetical protein R2789_04985 [Microthrixaceae bacterium]